MNDGDPAYCTPALLPVCAHALPYSRRFHRIPDLVVFPRNEDEVVQLVKVSVPPRHSRRFPRAVYSSCTTCAQCADKGPVMDAGGVCLIPYGGGTSVSGALGCPSNEDKRMMVVVSMKVKRSPKFRICAHVSSQVRCTNLRCAALTVCQSQPIHLRRLHTSSTSTMHHADHLPSAAQKASASF